MQHVTVRVPASTSNLGPGFDCLGVALRLHNEVTVRRSKTVSVDPMMQEVAALFFARTSVKPFPFSCRVNGDVPAARGLGSSVTLRLGLLHGLNVLAQRPLARSEIFQLCCELEGHPDNAAPGEYGGFNVIRGRQRQRFAVSNALKFILLIPNFEVRTEDARALLPKKLNRLDAVESCGNACAITAAFVSGDYAQLHGMFADHLHQPYRKHLVPFFDDVIAAAEKAGALGGFLSGSGSTVAALTLVAPQKVAAAMQAAAPTGTRVLVTTADNRGARLLPIEIRKSKFENFP
ncbi:MAG: homoserine kinase [Chthoniobacterales bacterium]